jgi:glycosyltransferase involved in cell wall biosynthesis
MQSVSVIIPAYNSAATIQDAVATARAQTHRPLEIIVIDDGSSDDTRSKLAELTGPNLIVIRNEKNVGGAISRNRGIDAARGDFIAFLDADDLWNENKLARQVELLSQHREPAFCFSALRFANEYAEHRIAPRRAPKPDERMADFMLKSGNIVQTSTLVVPRTALGACRFTETLRRFQDIDFVLQLDAAGVRALYIPDPLVEWRNVGNPKRVSANSDPTVIHAFIARHGSRLTLAQRLGLEVRSLGPAPGMFGAFRWSSRVLLSVIAGGIALPHALSLLLKHGLGARNFGALRARFRLGDASAATSQRRAA